MNEEPWYYNENNEQLSFPYGNDGEYEYSGDEFAQDYEGDIYYDEDLYGDGPYT